MEKKNYASGMSLQEAEGLLVQVQSAHRVLAAFYERLLGFLDGMARDLDEDLSFWYWNPQETWLPPRFTTDPLSRSIWDFLPLYAFSCAYWRVRGEDMHKGDIAVIFAIYTDDKFDSDNWDGKSHPDPLQMKSGKAVLRSYVYRCRKTGKAKFSPAFEEAEWVETTGKFRDIDENFSAVGNEWPLAEVIADPSRLISVVKGHCAEPGQ